MVGGGSRKLRNSKARSLSVISLSLSVLVLLIKLYIAHKVEFASYLDQRLGILACTQLRDCAWMCLHDFVTGATVTC